MGYPGSGKTTAAKLIHKLCDAEHLSSDVLRLQLFPKPTYTQAEHDAVYKELDRQTEELLAQGKNVVYDANLNRYVHRQEKYDIAKRTNAQTVLLWVEVPKTLARDRAVLRGHRHLVPEDETFESMFDRVAATIEEPHANEHVIKLHGKHIDLPLVAHAVERYCREHAA